MHCVNKFSKLSLHSCPFYILAKPNAQPAKCTKKVTPNVVLTSQGANKPFLILVHKPRK